jgi:hypothetical protein
MVTVIDSAAATDDERATSETQTAKQQVEHFVHVAAAIRDGEQAVLAVAIASAVGPVLFGT